MTPTEFRHIRVAVLALTQAQMAEWLGYRNRISITQFESGLHPVSAQTERLMQAFEAGYRPHAAERMRAHKEA